MTSDRPAADMRLLVEAMAQAVVEQPDQVRVEAVSEGEVTVLELDVAPADLGKVIGRQGRTARSLRTILSAAAAKLDREYELEILE